MKVTEDGGAPWWVERHDSPIVGMTYPVRHTACGKIHDAATVEIAERYADCTRWKCPHCGQMCDDRVIGWGGNIQKLDRIPASSSTGGEL